MRYFAEKHVLVGKRPSEIVLDWFNQALWLLSKHFPTLSTHRLKLPSNPQSHFCAFSLSYHFLPWSPLQLSFESSPGLHWVCNTLLCDWSRKLAPSSQPIRCKIKDNRDLVARVFPRFRKFAHFHFEFSLANDYVNLWFWLVVGISLVLVFRNSIAALSCQPPIWLLRRFWCHDIQMKSAQKSTILRLTHLWLSKNDDHLITRIQAWYPGRPRV